LEEKPQGNLSCQSFYFKFITQLPVANRKCGHSVVMWSHAAYCVTRSRYWEYRSWCRRRSRRLWYWPIIWHLVSPPPHRLGVCESHQQTDWMVSHWEGENL